MFKSHRLLIIVLATVFVAGTYCSWIQSLEGRAYDLFSYLLPTTGGPVKTAVVAIDQRSIKALGEWPWSRHDLANLVMHAHADGVKALGIMLPLDQPQMIKDPRNFEKQLAGVDKKLRNEIETVLRKLDPDPVFSSALNQDKNAILAIPYWPDYQGGEDLGSSSLQDVIEPLVTLPPTSVLSHRYFYPLIMLPQSRSLIGRAPLKEFNTVAAGIGLVQEGVNGATVRQKPLIIDWQVSIMRRSYCKCLPRQ